MKERILKIGIAVLNGLYSLMKLLPVQKKVVYLSRQQKTIPLDFALIREEMKKSHPDYKNVMLIKMVGDSFPEKIGYCFHILRQMYHLATAEAAIIDTYCIPVCILKQRDSLIVVQIWHALGAFKKFSCSILDQEEGRSSKMAKLMHMHENYTYVLTSSEHCLPCFQEAFAAKKEQMKVIPLPRVDYILDPKVQKGIRERIYAEYPQLKNTTKKILVYAPTFRKYDVDFNRAVEELVRYIDFDRYELIIKLHPLSNVTISNPAVIQDQKFVTHEIFQVADAVIADYSAVVFEAALLTIPMYFYTFDFDQYVDKRNFYLNYEEEMPGVIAKDAKTIVEAVEKDDYDLDRIRAFCDKMIARDQQQTSAQKIIGLITRPKDYE